MMALILGLVGWVGVHPNFAGLVVATIACSEALAFVGIFIPGSVMMLGAGMLIGVGALEFWSTFAWAVGGAIIGDGVSYWLGYRYKDRLAGMRMIRVRPQLLTRGRSFFLQHGGYSVVLARFVGPVRAIVPVVAGMLDMKPWRFYTYNIVSAVLWAPAHLIPGMVFGASLALAGEVAGRLAVGIAVLLVFIWLATWGIRTLYNWLRQHADSWVAAGVAWGRRYPRIAWFVGDVLDPAQPAWRPLVLWLVLLIAGTWLFFGVLEDVLSYDPLVYAGQSFYRYLQDLRTPDGDLLMTVFTELGDGQVALPVAVTVLVWFLWHRAWRDAKYWVAAMAFSVVAVFTLKFAVHLPRPVGLYSGIDAFSFPSGHSTLNTIIYGYLAVLCAPSVAARWRWCVYAIAMFLIAGIAFSRLYLGAHWLADVAAGLGLGTAWVALLAIDRARHADSGTVQRGLLPGVMAVFLVAAAWHVRAHLLPDMTRYSVRNTVQTLAFGNWWRGEWQQLPTYRIDMEGEQEQPLNVQWAGPLPVLVSRLAGHGWHKPLPLTWHTALNWLLPASHIAQLPVLPQLHRGRYDALILVHASEAGDSRTRQLILRLWDAEAILTNPDTPLWYGTVTSQRIVHLSLVSFPHNVSGYDAALDYFARDVSELRHKMVKRSLSGRSKTTSWSGATLLVTPVNSIR